VVGPFCFLSGLTEMFLYPIIIGSSTPLWCTRLNQFSKKDIQVNPLILIGQTKFFFSLVLRAQKPEDVLASIQKLLNIESHGHISIESGSKAALLNMRSQQKVQEKPIRLILYPSPLARDVFDFLKKISDADKNDSFLVCFTEKNREERGERKGKKLFASLLHSTSLLHPAESIQSSVTYTYDADNSVRIETIATEPVGFEDTILQYLFPALQLMYPRP
jgi:hypothetical protein